MGENTRDKAYCYADTLYIEKNSEYYDCADNFIAGYEQGVKDCINELRELQETFRHQSKWNHSGTTKLAPVELSDYLLRNILRKVKDKNE